ncbi:helix-turn-helix domain-containing protein [Ensifer sp. NBAIM29]|nr:helix-turn-helix domain-containing protein [Ensifer sp. NBAIM29]
MTTDPAFSAGKLPVSLQDVAETLGLPIALKVIEHFGGTEIKFPKSPASDHPVLQALGKEDGIALCSFLSGGFIYVPHMRGRKSIRAEVLALQESGKERREIARLLGVSQRHVRRMANKPATNQLDLFAND